MASDAGGNEAYAAGNLLGGLNLNVLELAVLADGGAPFGDADFGVDVGVVLVDQERNAHGGGAFFAGLGKEDDVAIERGALTLDEDDRHQRGGEIVFVVDGAAAVDVAAFAVGRERPIDPFLGVDVDGVGVADDEERLLLAGAFEAGDDVGADDVGIRQIGAGEDFGFDTFAVEDGLEIVDDGLFAAARIGRVNLDQGREMLQRFLVDLRPFEGLGLSAVRERKEADEGEAKHMDRG